MAWTKNNNKNVRFNPNRKDDRLLLAEVTARRVHKPRVESKKEEELISTDLEHVLGMPPDTRVDWLQMALMQSALGKLKAQSLYDVIAKAKFANTSGSARKPLKAMVLANLHLFNSKQKKVIQDLWNPAERDRGAEPDGMTDGQHERGEAAGGGDRRARENGSHERGAQSSSSARDGSADSHCTPRASGNGGDSDRRLSRDQDSGTNSRHDRRATDEAVLPAGSERARSRSHGQKHKQGSGKHKSKRSRSRRRSSRCS